MPEPRTKLRVNPGGGLDPSQAHLEVTDRDANRIADVSTSCRTITTSSAAPINCSGSDSRYLFAPGALAGIGSAMVATKFLSIYTDGAHRNSPVLLIEFPHRWGGLSVVGGRGVAMRWSG